MTTNQNYNAEARLRAIAMNAVREAMLVYQRWDRPFTDDDAARVNDVFMLLHLQESADYNEHAPLIAKNQPPVSEAVLKIANILDDEFVGRGEKSPGDFGEADAATVAVKLPRAKTSV